PNFGDLNEPDAFVRPQLHALPHAAIRPEIDPRPTAAEHLDHPASEWLLQEQGLPLLRHAREAGDLLIPIVSPEIESAMRPRAGPPALIDEITEILLVSLGD